MFWVFCICSKVICRLVNVGAATALRYRMDCILFQFLFFFFGSFYVNKYSYISFIHFSSLYPLTARDSMHNSVSEFIMVIYFIISVGLWLFLLLPQFITVISIFFISHHYIHSWPLRQMCLPRIQKEGENKVFSQTSLWDVRVSLDYFSVMEKDWQMSFLRKNMWHS